MATLKYLFGVLLLFLAVAPAQAHNPILPPGFVMEKSYVSGLSSPTDLKFAPDGRIFITEKTGAVRIVENGNLLSQPFYTVATQTAGERGLDGIALDPDFERNGYVYLYYTLADENRNIVIRVTAAGNAALPGSELELLRLEEMWAAFHNGAGMVFDTTGKLLIGVGDGTLLTTSQNMNTRLGKILRINPDGSIPSDNPFYNETTGLNRAIAVYGVRNPYTMAISRTSGRIFFNDVGNSEYEEVNEYFPGANYGWHLVEGPLNGAPPPDNRYRDPIHAYDHDYGCAAVGATFYEPNLNLFPEAYSGVYFFLDLCEGIIMTIDPADMSFSVFGEDLDLNYNNLETSPDGHLFLINFETGDLSRISYQGEDAAPRISVQPEIYPLIVGESINLSVTAVGSNLQYDWYRNGNLAQSGDDNNFYLINLQTSHHLTQVYVRVSNANGEVTSDTLVLQVIDGSRPEIQLQNLPATYAAGDTLTFAAQVSDPDQQSFSAGQLTWKVDFHHDFHKHPAMPATPGMFSGTYPTETFGEVDTNVYYRVLLLVEDSTGLTREVYQDIDPEKVTLFIESQPPGVEISIDGQEVAADYALRSVRNLSRTIEVPAYAVLGDSLYQFQQWADGATDRTRTFAATADTLGIRYTAIQAYAASFPTLGNMEIFVDTGDQRDFYRAVQVSQVKENWDALSPFWHDQPNFPSDYWSVRWEGDIVAPVSDEYTFYLLHDAQVRFMLNGELLIDARNEVPNSTQEDTVRIFLERGDSLRLQIDYDHFTEGARVELDWQFSLVERHTVPFARRSLAPETAKAPGGILVFPNPVTGETLSLCLDPGLNLGDRFTAKIFDVKGILHKEITLINSEPVVLSFVPEGLVSYWLPIADLPSGMYILRVEYAGGEQFVRFLRN
ncbi:MAG: PQQ-dependent sugar dehydrogenase [Bacteroidota bacterium]